MSFCFDKWLFWRINFVIFILFFLNAVTILLLFNPDFGFQNRFYRIFNFDTELNVPSAASSINLLVACLFLANIAYRVRLRREKYENWLLLSLVFLFLSIDEAFVVHERLIQPLRSAFNTSGLFYFGWVIPYMLALPILFLKIRSLFFDLEVSFRNSFALSGAVYLSGAVGMEMLGGMHFETYGYDLSYHFYYTIEELLEMLGISLFLSALASYKSQKFGSISTLQPWSLAARAANRIALRVPESPQLKKIWWLPSKP